MKIRSCKDALEKLSSEELREIIYSACKDAGIELTDEPGEGRITLAEAIRKAFDPYILDKLDDETSEDDEGNC